MRYLSAHYIFPVSSPPLKNGIVCVDEQGTVTGLTDTGGRIEEREQLEFYNGILVPGFVNAHCHLELSHLRGTVAPHAGLPGFLTQVGRARGEAGPAAILAAAEAADGEMERNGIVAAGDISNSGDTIRVKRGSRLRYRTFVEVFGLSGRRAGAIFAAAQQLAAAFRESGLPASIVPHAMYSVSGELSGLLPEYYRAYPAIASVHHQESSEETGLYPGGEGSLYGTFLKNGLIPAGIPRRPNPAGDMEQCLSPAQQCLLVHNTFVSQSDIRQRTEHLKNIYWVLCPGSNLFIQNRLPDLTLFAGSGLKVCLGTDSLASNTALSILAEMKIIRKHSPYLPLPRLLEWATLNGARALGFDDRLGSIGKGKTPGINLITHIDYDRMQITADSTVEALTGGGR